MNEVLNCLETRRSVRKYLPKQIADAELNAILEAGIYAPTAMGRQSPKIVVLQKPEDVAELERMNAAVLGNLMNAAHALGVGSCWIHRAREEFASGEGKALLKRWGIEGDWVGVGHCILGYAAEPAAPAKPRKADYIVRV